MKTFALSVIILLLTSFAALALDTAKGFETASVNIGYLRQEDFGKRVAVKDIAAYIKRLQAICGEFFAQTATPEDLSILVAIKPTGRSRVWFVSSRTPAANEKRDQLRTKLEAVELPKVTGGPIAYAIESRIAGGSGKDAKEAGAPPTPKEWHDALSKQKEPLLFDGLLPLVFPE